MKKYLLLGLLFLVLATVGVSIALQKAQAVGQVDGTTITVDKTAQGIWLQRLRWVWDIEKSASVEQIRIPQGQTGNIDYTLNVIRSVGGVADFTGVGGQICLTNTGTNTTHGLVINDQVQYATTNGGPLLDVPGAALTINPVTQLAAGQTRCFPYRIGFSPVQGAFGYWNKLTVTITNYVGHINTAFGPAPVLKRFSLPANPAVTEVDGEATVTDDMTCPAGFTCITNAGPWDLADSATLQYRVTVTNDSVPCGENATIENTATVTDTTKFISHDDSSSVNVTTGECNEGCTLTIGYWKNHDGSGPQSDVVTPLLPIMLGNGGPKSILVSNTTQSHSILSVDGTYGPNSNGISKLYAQLLAAKLNIASGASASAIAPALTRSDNFLGRFDWHDWSGLPGWVKTMVLSWHSSLDGWNNGLTGPGHCGEQGSGGEGEGDSN